MGKILILGGCSNVRESMAEELAAEGHIVAVTAKPALFKELLATFDPDLLVFDLTARGQDRWEMMKEVKKQTPHLPALIYASPGELRMVKGFKLSNGPQVKGFFPAGFGAGTVSPPAGPYPLSV